MEHVQPGLVYTEDISKPREMTGESFVLTEEWKERFFRIHEILKADDLRLLSNHIINNFSDGTVILRSLTENDSSKIMGPWELACLAQALQTLKTVKEVIEKSIKENPLPSN